MNSHEIRLLFNMMKAPALFFVLAGLLAFSAGLLARTAHIAPLAHFLHMGCAISVVAGAILLLYNSVVSLRAEYGKGNVCPACSGPCKFVSNGRYGPYWKCLKCGQNRPQRD
jgi:hypothetical protein